MAPHSSTLAWKIPWMEEPGRLQSMGSRRVGHDRATSLSLSCIGEGNGNPLQCSCLENPRDRGAWWAAVYGVTQSWTWLKQLSSSSRFLEFFYHNSNRCIILFKIHDSIFYNISYVLYNYYDHASAAAKLLQSCPTLWDPTDSNPPGFSVPGILQARILEWVAISFSNAWSEKWSHSVMSDSLRPHGL